MCLSLVSFLQSVFWLTACLVLAAGVRARPGPPATSPNPDSRSPTVPALQNASSAIYLPEISPDESLDYVIPLNGDLGNSVTPSSSESDPVVANDTLDETASVYSDLFITDSSSDKADIHLSKSDIGGLQNNASVDLPLFDNESQNLALRSGETESFVPSANDSLNSSFLFSKSHELNFPQNESFIPSQSQNVSMVYIVSFRDKENPAFLHEGAKDYIVLNETLKDSDSEDMGPSQQTSADSFSSQVSENQFTLLDNYNAGNPTDIASENLVALFWAPENTISTHMSKERSVSLNAFTETHDSPYNVIKDHDTPQSASGNEVPFQIIPESQKHLQTVSVNQALLPHDVEDHIPSQNLPNFAVHSHNIPSDHVLPHSVSEDIFSTHVQILAPSYDEPTDHVHSNIIANITSQNLSDHGVSHSSFEDNSPHPIQVSAPSNADGVSVFPHTDQVDIPTTDSRVDIVSHVPEVDVKYHNNQVPNASSHFNADVTSSSTQDVFLQSNLVNVPSQYVNVDLPSPTPQPGVSSHKTQSDLPSHDSEDVASVEVSLQNTGVDGPYHASQVDVHLQNTPVDIQSQAAHVDVQSQNIPMNDPSHVTNLQDVIPSHELSLDNEPIHIISNVNVPLQSEDSDHSFPQSFPDHVLPHHSFSEHDTPLHSPPSSHAPPVNNPEYDHPTTIPEDILHTESFPEERELSHSNSEGFPSNIISEPHIPSSHVLIDQFASENAPLNRIPNHASFGRHIQSPSVPEDQAHSHTISVDSSENVSESLVPRQSGPLDQINPHGLTESHVSSSGAKEYHVSSFISPSDAVQSFEPQKFPPQVTHSNDLSDPIHLHDDSLEGHTHAVVSESDASSINLHRLDTVTQESTNPILSHDPLPSHTNEQNHRHSLHNANAVGTVTHHNPKHGVVDQTREGTSSFQERLVKPVPTNVRHSEDILSHQRLTSSFPPHIPKLQSDQHYQPDHTQNIQAHRASSRKPSFGPTLSPAVPHTGIHGPLDGEKGTGKGQV